MNSIFKKEQRNRDFDAYRVRKQGAASGACPTDTTFTQTAAVLTPQRKSHSFMWSRREAREQFCSDAVCH